MGTKLSTSADDLGVNRELRDVRDNNVPVVR
jgi:hypothetical protein